MRRHLVSAGLAGLAALAALLAPAPAGADGRPTCAACHEELHPGLVADWKSSRHAGAGVGCEACHGSLHREADDTARAAMPTPETCRPCHELQVAQFKRSKHARAWSAVKAIPSFHHLSFSDPSDTTGCAACHRIGLKTEEEAAALKQAGATRGQASCDACHTRHAFSKQEARQPEACRTCHGTLQYEAWSASKHGTRHALQASGRVTGGVPAPTCQGCHLQNGTHANRTPWGNLGLRLPLPQDPAWAEDVKTLAVALGVLSPTGGEGPRAAAIQQAGLFFLDRVDYQNERHKLTNACRQCHGAAFVREQLDARDAVVRNADALCARAVREVAALYADGVLKATGPGPHPDLATAPLGAPIERLLATMVLEHRGKLMAHAFHMSPELATWRGTMASDLAGLENLADELRARAGAKAGAAGAAAPAAKKR